MRKSFKVLLSLLIFLGISLTLSAQSNEEELDQLELMKQFIGTWRAETGEDTVVSTTYEPIGDGILITQENITNGVTYRTVKAVMGVSTDKKTIIVSVIRQDGTIGFHYGKFVSNNKCILEVYRDNVQHPLNIQEFEIQSPDTFTTRGKYRGEQMKWDAEWWVTTTFHKIK